MCEIQQLKDDIAKLMFTLYGGKVGMDIDDGDVEDFQRAKDRLLKILEDSAR